jgi:hypothetical protein
MNCLLTSLVSEQSIHERSRSGQTDRRVQRPLHSHRDLPFPEVLVWHGRRSAENHHPHVPIGLEVPWLLELTALPSIDKKAWVPSVEHGRIALGWRSPLPILLDAGVRTDRSHAVVAARNGYVG